MRTRIALGATFGVVFIIVSALAPAARADQPTANTSNATDAVHPVPIARPGPSVPGQDPPAPKASGSGDAVAVLRRAATLIAASPPDTQVATPPPVPAAPTTPADTVTPDQRAAWERVALCEEGGNWQAEGSRFSGGLGITRDNWIAYGGRDFSPEAAMATEDQQIMVAERIQSSPPDQDGCRGW